MPLTDRPWNLGLIVGPSGCGKSTIARTFWPEPTARAASFTWHPDHAVIDDFPETMPIKDVTQLLSAVGFSSPPAWLRPYHVLSTGQRFRVQLARLLAECDDLAVMDEFTSTVDRTVAQIGSAALAKTVRQRQSRFIAVTCHDDVETWLQPNWTYRPAEALFQWRSLQRRPTLTLRIVRCASSAWPLFAPHHYLSHTINRSAACFLASWQSRPVAFSAWLQFPHKLPTRREHRTVTLPDYQGIGIGNALSDFIASLYTALGIRAQSTTTHPAMIASRRRSPHWRMHRPPSFTGPEANKAFQHATTRLTAGFTNVGPPADKRLARELCHGA